VRGTACWGAGGRLHRLRGARLHDVHRRVRDRPRPQMLQQVARLRAQRAGPPLTPPRPCCAAPGGPSTPARARTRTRLAVTERADATAAGRRSSQPACARARLQAPKLHVGVLVVPHHAALAQLHERARRALAEVVEDQPHALHPLPLGHLRARPPPRRRRAAAASRPARRPVPSALGAWRVAACRTNTALRSALSVQGAGRWPGAAAPAGSGHAPHARVRRAAPAGA